MRLEIDGDIEPILAEYIVNGIQQANRDHASLILITINTPGGLDTSMRAIIQAILTSEVPVVTYVSPTGSRAASAGFFMKAPPPVFTSSTSASMPSAIFLLMMEAQIRKGLSTVAVTSRRA